MILNILKELLEKDFDSITSSIKIQNVDFHVGKHTPIKNILDSKTNYEAEKCLWAYNLGTSIVVFNNLIEIDDISIPKEEFLESDENYLILTYGKILIKELS